MTATRERMWHAVGYITHNEEFAKAHGGYEVIRDDPDALVQSENVRALIAAAVEGAVKTSERLTEDAVGTLDSDGYPVSAWMEGITTSIRALTPLDAKAALDRMLQEARRDEREKARREAKAVLTEVSAALHQTARDRDLSEIELNFMRRVDALIQEPPR